MATPVEGVESGNGIPVGEVQGEPTTPVENTPGPNPNWDSVLNLLPENFRSVVTPHFQEWDDNAKKRIETIKTDYADYETFREYGIGRQDLESGLRLMQMMNDDPKQVYDALAAQLNIQIPVTPEAVPVVTEEGETPVLPPGYDKLQEGVELMAKRMLASEQAQQEDAANKQLETELATVEQKYGKFIPELFLPYLSNKLGEGLSVDKAAEQFFAIQGQIQQQTIAAQPYAPNVLGGNSGGGAGLPSSNIDPAKLDATERKNLVVQMLRAASQGQ